MGKRKGKKQYYSGAGKKGKFSGQKKMLTEGMAGFLITCNNRERETIQEAYNVLNEYADKLVGPEIRKAVPKENEKENKKDPNDVDANSDEEEEGDIDDIDAALEKEKADILQVVNTKEERRFTRVDSGANNCIFIKTTLEDPCSIVSSIVEDVSVNKVNKARYILRLVPVIGTCKAYDKNINELLESKLGQVFQAGKEVSYCIIYKCRNNNQVKQHEMINTVNEVVKDKFTDATIDLKSPDVCLYVEIIRNIFCLGIAKDFFKHKKYNLQEMVKEEQDKASTTDEAAKDTQDVKEEKKEEESTNNASDKNESKEPETSTDENNDNSDVKTDDSEENKVND
eukprot:TRINITY_DN4033_c0_g1_i11.p1 TRINITY_DN4033_c0_g1~~TRINITY_DN4033_c0_g1_i11.p1  ORF type:complete len:341 (-),score=110.55 TRINITY_DN4033_c0_g1_i11:52-1074(-)